MTGATLEVVLPVHNEEADLAGSVLEVRTRLATLPWSSSVTIADNASTDLTPAIARELADTYADVRVVHLTAKGRGGALRQVWGSSQADVLAYMDIDLSTDLAALEPLVTPVAEGWCEIAIGSRLHPEAAVRRGVRREVLSRGYNVLLRGAFGTQIYDAQCGFKAIRREVAQLLLPLVEDDSWFFDSELVLLAERAGLRVHELPVDWTDDPNSSVRILRTAYDDLRGIRRLRRSLASGRTDVSTVAARLASVAEAPDNLAEWPRPGTPAS